MDQEHLSGYFDYNATTPISNEVVQLMIPAITLFANPSSSNSYSLSNKKAIADTRDHVAQLLHTDPEQVYFTSGGSEANNWAIKGVLFKQLNRPGHIVTTAIEHASVIDTVKYCAEHFGFEVTYLKPNAEGAINIADVKNALRDNTQLITIMYANNETGVLQPIPDIAKLANENAIPLHVDAVQFVGKRKIDVEALGIDYLSLSAHKFYGPKGIGCLYIKDVNSIGPLIHGGGQELSMRSGTENFVSVVGMLQAAQEASQMVEQWDQASWQCKQHMMSLLAAAPIDVTFNGSTSYETTLSNTLNLSIKGIRGEALAARMEMLHGYIISIGSACSNNKTTHLSHVLLAMNMDEASIQSAIRVSFGRFTSLADIEKFVATLVAETHKLIEISEG
jgi:cysteine desulfurase